MKKRKRKIQALFTLILFLLAGCGSEFTESETEKMSEFEMAETVERQMSSSETEETKLSSPETVKSNHTLLFDQTSFDIYIESEEDYQILSGLSATLDSLEKEYNNTLSDFQKVSILQGEINILRSINDICHNSDISEIEERSNSIIKEKEEQISLIKSNLPAYEPLSRPDDSYDYPEKEGNIDEYVSSCMIPEEVLKVMSTESLIQAIFEYPCPVIFVASSTEGQVELLRQNCSAFKELETRGDAKEKLKEKLLDVENILLRMDENTPEMADVYSGYDLLNLAYLTLGGSE